MRTEAPVWRGVAVTVVSSPPAACSSVSQYMYCVLLLVKVGSRLMPDRLSALSAVSSDSGAVVPASCVSVTV